MNKWLMRAFALALAILLMTGCAVESTVFTAEETAAVTAEPAAVAETQAPAAEEQTAAAAEAEPQAESITCTCTDEEGFHNIILDDVTYDMLMNAGYTYGDSVDVVFSNGVSFIDIPFIDSYNLSTGRVALVDYQSGDHVVLAKCYASDLWDEVGYQEGDTMTVTLRERGKYLAIQTAFTLESSDVVTDYPSEEAFANFRALYGGNLVANRIYRGFSPIDYEQGRAAVVDSLLQKYGINYVINIANSEETFLEIAAQEDFASPYFMSLYEKGQVYFTCQGAAYRTEECRSTLIDVFNTMCSYEGPYYLHCLEGRDRTGFACMLLECIAGCTYEEMAQDYMMSYVMLFGVDPEEDTEKYETIQSIRFDDMFIWLCGVDTLEAAKNADVEAVAHDYLIAGGMTEEEYTKLKTVLTVE